MHNWTDGLDDLLSSATSKNPLLMGFTVKAAGDPGQLPILFI